MPLIESSVAKSSLSNVSALILPAWLQERLVYQSLLDRYVKLRKSQDEHLIFLHRLKIKPEVVVLEDSERNEMPESDSETMT